MASIRRNIARWFQLHWWKRYLGDKRPPRKYLDARAAYWKDFLERLAIAPEAGACVLDAGCGPVGIFIALGEKSRVDAVDPLLGKYEEELEHFKKAYYPRVHFYSDSIEAFFAENKSECEKYDYIFCLNALNRFDDMRASLMDMRNHLKPDGRLVLLVEVHRFLPVKYLFRLLFWSFTNPREADLQDYLALLQSCGLKQEKGFLNKKGALFSYWCFVCRL